MYEILIQTLTKPSKLPALISHTGTPLSRSSRALVERMGDRWRSGGVDAGQLGNAIRTRAAAVGSHQHRDARRRALRGHAGMIAPDEQNFGR